MNLISTIASLMILAGAVLMATSIVKFRGISRLLDEFALEGYGKIERFFRVHQAFMLLFLLGYLVVLYGTLAEVEYFGEIVVGIIFLFSAIFVLLSILLQLRMLGAIRKNYLQALQIRDRFKKEREQLLETRDTLKQEHEKLAETRDTLKRERSQLMETNMQLKREMEDRKRAEKEKQSLEAKLRQSQKMESIGTLAGGIAHDFNNILSAIMGFTEMAIYKMPANSKVKEDLEQVLKAGNRAKDLVKQILAFSRQSEQERRPIRIDPLVKETLKLLRASFPATIQIRPYIDSKGGIVEADPTQIHQVLMNLCTNAYDAMKQKGGVLKIDVRRVNLDGKETAILYPELNPGPYQRLTVSDTGHGMDAATMERIFDPYFTTKKTGKGTGMGLAVVHGIVKSHGGVINVHSEKGKGTTFQVLLPSIESVVKEEVKAFEPLPTGKERILFVDDEAALADLGKQMLESLGYKIASKTSSVEALETFRAQPDKFDVVITDKTMPNMTGFDLAKAIRKVRPNIPIILCTGFSDSTLLLRAEATGINEIVMKPLLMRDLAEVIRKVLA